MVLAKFRYRESRRNFEEPAPVASSCKPSKPRVLNGWRPERERSLQHRCVALVGASGRPAAPRAEGDLIADETPAAREDAAAALAVYGEQPRVDPGGLAFTEDQVLGDWFPEDLL